MKRLPISTYPSEGELAAQIDALERRALALPPTTEAHRSIMQELGRLRASLAATRFRAGPTPGAPAASPGSSRQD